VPEAKKSRRIEVSTAPQAPAIEGDAKAA